MINYKFKPEHLHPAFIDLLDGYTKTRIEAKQRNDKIAAAGLKIVILSIYGKMGNEYHFLHDMKAMYQVTLNGQLSLLMLVEKLEEQGITVFYANTDGITALVSKDKENVYEDICGRWQEYMDFNLEFEDYKSCINRDVNNYIWIPADESKDLKYKGFFDPQRWNDESKGFDKPIIPLSISKYFTENIPVKETIQSHRSIYDFCMAQKVGSDFNVYFDYESDGQLVTERQQDTNRYYIGKKGGFLYKKKEYAERRTALVSGHAIHLLNNVVDEDAHNYPIDYRYYIKEAYKTINLFKHKQQELF